MTAVCSLGFDIARVYISPTICNNDNTINRDRLQDLFDHLTILDSLGVSRYFVTVWLPPAHMKLPDRVRYGKYEDRIQYLDPVYADGQGYDYADFLAEVIHELSVAGFPGAEAVSIQNEPGVKPIYDGCVWTQTEEQKENYRTVVKQLRQKLDAYGLQAIPVIVNERAGFGGLTTILGSASADGFSEIEADPEFKAAIGGFCYHSYYTAGNIKDINAALDTYDLPVWMTEYSGPQGIRGELRANSGYDQLDWTLNFVRRMAGDIIDLNADYWFFWRGYHPAKQIYDQDLVCDGPEKAKAYHVFRKLWTTIKPGWKVKAISDTDPLLRSDNLNLINSGSGDQWSAPVDLLAFENSMATRTLVLLVNNDSLARTIDEINGLKGHTAHLCVSDSARDMKEQAERPIVNGVLSRGSLTLPPHSVTLVSTVASQITTAAAIPTTTVTHQCIHRTGNALAIAAPSTGVLTVQLFNLHGACLGQYTLAAGTVRRIALPAAWGAYLARVTTHGDERQLFFGLATIRNRVWKR